MQTKLISLTYGPGMTAEELIVFTARVSNPENQNNFDTADRLIAYMVCHQHWSPFEMADMTIEVKTSRAIAAQILRHRSFSFQEFSQRYSAATGIEPIELRAAAATNRQSSSAVITDGYINAHVDVLMHKCKYLYDELLRNGVAKESARMVLPLATQTTLYMKGSVRSWIHYLQIRCAEETQAEHRQVADSIKDIFKAQFPIISNALNL